MKKYELMALPYAPDALEPVISKETIGFHHGKHLQAYVDNLNGLASPPNPGLTPNPSPRGEGNLEGEGSLGELEMLKELVLHSEGAVFNNAGQILNHELYFLQFKPVGEAVQGPEGALAAQIEKFGSGWVWLSADADGSLVITQEQGASNPVVKGLKPLLTFDVWEHAYYLDYQNRRAAHLSALWQIVDWRVIEKRYDGGTKAEG